MANKEYPKDSLGNDLKVGRLIRVDLEKPFVLGRIKSIDPGGEIQMPLIGPRDFKNPNAGKPALRLGMLVIEVELTTAFQPGAVIKQFMTVREPDGPIAVPTELPSQPGSDA